MRVAALLLLAAAVETAASSTGPCVALDQYMASAATGFQSLRGRAKDGGGWTASVFLPQANVCSIDDSGDGHWTATCTYLFLDENDRRAGLAQMRSAIEGCLGWPQGSLRNSRDQAYKGRRGYDIVLQPFGRFDARLEITHLRAWAR